MLSNINLFFSNKKHAILGWEDSEATQGAHVHLFAIRSRTDLIHDVNRNLFSDSRESVLQGPL